VKPPDSLLQHYAEAEIVTINGEQWAGTSSLPFPLFIITAHNPFSIKTEAINDSLHCSLKLYLAEHFPRAQWEEVVGQSKDGQWKEAGLAIAGLSQGEAVLVGQHFQQWAIFLVDHNGLSVVPCQSSPHLSFAC
jgi:hypothetical protein